MPRKLIKAPVDFKETKKLYIPYISSNKKKKRNGICFKRKQETSYTFWRFQHGGLQTTQRS